MENIKKSKEKVIKIEDYIIFALLFMWMLMPIIQTIKDIYKVIDLKEIYLLLMKIIGVFGIGISIIIIYLKIKNSENKKEKIKELIPIFLFVIYMIWTLISCINANNTKYAFEGSRYRKEGYFMYLNYAGYFLCAFLLENKKLKKILIDVLIITAIFLIIISRITVSGEKYTNIFVNTDITKTVFAQFNHYGYFLMMSLVSALGLFINEKNKLVKIIYLISYAVISYAMIFNNTFGCYLAVIVILLGYLIYALIKKKDRILVLIASGVFIIVSCYTVNTGGRNIAYQNMKEFITDIKIIITKVTGIGFKETEIEDEELEKEFKKVGTNRMVLWKNGLKFISKKPIIGYGADNLKREYLSVSVTDQDRPHNLLIYLACVSGIPGMLIYVTAVGIIVVRGIKKLINTNGNGKIYLICVVTYLASSMFGNSMFYTSPYFFIFLGSLMGWTINKEN